jgi:Zn-dependent protease with chaperone function
MEIEKRYKLLHVISTIFKIVAWIVLILGLLASIGALVLSLTGGLLSDDMGVIGPRIITPMRLGIPAFLVGLLITLLNFCTWYAAGALIALFIAIEENTRATAQWLESQPQAATSTPPTYDPAMMQTPPPPSIRQV